MCLVVAGCSDSDTADRSPQQPAISSSTPTPTATHAPRQDPTPSPTPSPLPVDGSALSSLIDEIESTIRRAAEFEAADKSYVSTTDPDYELHSATVRRLEEWTAVVRAYVMLHPDDVERLMLQARVSYAYTSMTLVQAELAKIRGGFDAGARMAEFQKPLDHALELDDGLAEVHYWKARLYTLRGPYERVSDNIDSAIRSASRAVELDATNLLYREALASYLFRADRRSEAVAILGAVVAEDDPKYLLLTDMQQMPIPEEAMFDAQATIEQARVEAVPAVLSEDYPHPMLRIATYWIAQPASEIEEFYQRRWHDLEFREVIRGIEPIGTKRYIALLRDESETGQGIANMMISVLEMRDPVPEVQPIPVDDVISRITFMNFRNFETEGP
ncbi:MAG: hypothetical protein O3A47_07130 [Chloroflexi bacterium]|nr:hypothetical protein [Chloroflexota bacterium]